VRSYDAPHGVAIAPRLCAHHSPQPQDGLISQRFGANIICWGEVIAHLFAEGVPPRCEERDAIYLAFQLGLRLSCYQRP